MRSGRAHNRPSAGGRRDGAGELQRPRARDQSLYHACQRVFAGGLALRRPIEERPSLFIKYAQVGHLAKVGTAKLPLGEPARRSVANRPRGRMDLTATS